MTTTMRKWPAEVQVDGLLFAATVLGEDLVPIHDDALAAAREHPEERVAGVADMRCIVDAVGLHKLDAGLREGDPVQLNPLRSTA